MQSQDHVRVVEGDAEGHSGRTLGQAELVTSDHAVMRVGYREPTPSLPLHVVLVPVAAGGDRGEHTKIDVTEVIPAEGDESMVALRLARAVPGWTQPRVVGLASLTSKPWWCKLFPSMC
ncbi:hypothetical protein BJF80_04455 [Serinicoccus sp. CUA-874]|uniref:hypothetical protein n=1 Tax=Serinicoccus sp. CUA-874 TaxID=1517939 RepID=UPI000967A4B7|nr:hypothetical protein [Serinicoccus sp. CUA-874]OLT16617.1 hypothetical protein BJF80_04455 [Serinicoccus sp. CUA-874]OLT24698.1 hypothetical protein BJF82_13155 [Kytococcus sp. CUA-901]